MLTEGDFGKPRKVLSDEECGRLRLFRMLLDEEETFNLLETDVFPKEAGFTISEIECVASLALEKNRPDNN